MGQVLDPSRGLGMTGEWVVGGEAITWYCSYAGSPPRSYFILQHERPRPRDRGVMQRSRRQLVGVVEWPWELWRW